MPLSKEGEFIKAHINREDEQRFLEEFGPEKFQEKLDREGIYAYGFPSIDARRLGINLLGILQRECLWGSNEELVRKFRRRLEVQHGFGFDVFHSSIPETAYVLGIEKPFPKAEYEEILASAKLPFQEEKSSILVKLASRMRMMWKTLLLNLKSLLLQKE